MFFYIWICFAIVLVFVFEWKVGLQMQVPSMPLVPKVSACLASRGAKGVEGAVELPRRLNDWELVTRQFAFKAAHEVGVQGAHGVQGVHMGGVRRSLGRVRQLVMEGWQGEYRGLLIGEKLRGGFLNTPYTKHTPSQKWTFCLVFSSPSTSKSEREKRKPLYQACK